MYDYGSESFRNEYNTLLEISLLGDACERSGTPLAIHALGRLACGAFLYGFKVRQLEIEHRKPVVFERA